MHLTGRPRPRTYDVPSWIKTMSAEQRLVSILEADCIRGYATASREPVVWLTLATGVGPLVRDGGYEPWGLVFPQDAVEEAGGVLVEGGDTLDWRLPGDVPLRSLPLEAVVVARPSWPEPAVRTRLRRGWPGHPLRRWWWNPTEGRLEDVGTPVRSTAEA